MTHIQELTQNLYTTLPREIREIIYGYILNEDLSVQQYASQRLLILDPNIIFPFLAAEAVEHLYTHHHHHYFVDMPQTARDYFSRDALGVHLTPSDVKIKSLTFKATTYPGRTQEITTDLLFLTSLNVGKDFNLAIRLGTYLPFAFAEMRTIFDACKTVKEHFGNNNTLQDITWTIYGILDCSVVERLHWSQNEWRQSVVEILETMPYASTRQHLASSFGFDDPFAGDSDVEDRVVEQSEWDGLGESVWYGVEDEGDEDRQDIDGGVEESAVQQITVRGTDSSQTGHDEYVLV